MNIEDQVAAIFAKANPVPSLDLLDPVDSVDVDSLRDGSERERATTELKTVATTELKTIQAIDSQLGRPWLAPAMATIAVLVVAIPILVGVTPLGANPTPAEQVANEFMDAIEEHDGLAIRGMYSFEDHEIKWNPDFWPAVTKLHRALGYEYTEVDCVEQPPINYAGTETTPVACSSTLQQDLTEALGLEATESTYMVYISGGELVRTGETWPDSNSMDQAFNEFQAWVQRNHPDQQWSLYSDPLDRRLTALYANNLAVVDDESLARWEQHVDEFVAEHEG